MSGGEDQSGEEDGHAGVGKNAPPAAVAADAL
jgi:hypothetical protein